MPRTIEELEKLAIAHHFVTINGVRYEIELVNTDNQIVVCFNPATDEYDHFEYNDLLEAEFSSKYRKYTVRIPEIHLVELEVEATTEDEAKEIAATMYADDKLEKEPVYDHTLAQSDWTLDY